MSCECLNKAERSSCGGFSGLVGGNVGSSGAGCAGIGGGCAVN